MTTRTAGSTVFAFVVVAGLVAGCDGSGSPTTSGEPLGSFAVSTEVPANETRTIARGARVTAGKGAVLTVRGRLVVDAPAGAHARIVPAASGETWGGVVVEAGGTLEVKGLDLEYAETALSVQPGALRASYAEGTIARAAHPFQVAREAELELRDVTVLLASDSSGIAGTFRASRLDYQKSGAAGGLIMNDANATFDVADSRFRGTADAGGDYIISYGAKLVRLAYSTITGAHCAFHFNDVQRFEIDHVTAGADSPTGAGDLVEWGAMLYGSGAGPNVISNSNFVSTTLNLEQLGTNGPLTITNTFTSGKNELTAMGWTWLPADVASAPISDAQPR
jgi:hypothetical protein